MAAALASTPSRARRTSLGEPVEPLVESSSARSGWSACRDSSDAPLATLRAGDDVGRVGLLQSRGGGRRGDQDDLLGGQGGDVLDDGVDVVARREEHEPATPGVRRGDLLDAAREVGVGERAGGGDQGPSLAEGGEVGDEGRRGGAHLGGGGHPPNDRR